MEKKSCWKHRFTKYKCRLYWQFIIDVSDHKHGLSEIQIWEQATLEHLCILSISWFAFVTLGLFGPRRLGAAIEHPRDCGVSQKVCNGSIPPPQGKESTSGRRKRSWKRLRLEWPSWSSRADLCWVTHSPSTESRSRRRPNFGKTYRTSRSPSLHLIFVILCVAWADKLVT